MGISDFFKPKYKHSDPDVRFKYINAKLSIDILKEIAITDTDIRNRNKAINYINTEKDLKEIHNLNSDADLLSNIGSKIHEIQSAKDKEKQETREILDSISSGNHDKVFSITSKSNRLFLRKLSETAAIFGTNALFNDFVESSLSASDSNDTIYDSLVSKMLKPCKGNPFGLLYWSMHEYPDSGSNQLDALSNIQTKQVNIQYELALVKSMIYMQRDKGKATSELHKALTVRNDSLQSLWSIDVISDNIDERVKMLSYGFELSNHPAFKLSLANIFKRKGDYKKASILFSEAKALANKHSNPNLLNVIEDIS